MQNLTFKYFIFYVIRKTKLNEFINVLQNTFREIKKFFKYFYVVQNTYWGNFNYFCWSIKHYRNNRISKNACAYFFTDLISICFINLNLFIYFALLDLFFPSVQLKKKIKTQNVRDQQKIKQKTPVLFFIQWLNVFV